MKVTIVAPVHIWDDVRVFKKEALSLAKDGYNVTLIARIKAPSIIEGIKILPVYGCYQNRLLRFLSLPIVIFQVLRQEADIYHLHNPDTLPIVLFLRLIGQKVIYDTHEDFSKRILSKQWIPFFLRKYIAFLVKKLENFTAQIANVSIATQEEVVKRLGKKSVLIENPPRVHQELIKNVLSIANQIEPKGCDFRLVYIGGVESQRGLYEMVDAMELVGKKINCRLWLIGPAHQEELNIAKKKNGWSYIDYHPRMPQEKAFAYVSKSDIGLIYINDISDYSHSDPNKIYEYMLFGKPFIASNFRKWIEKFDSKDIGFFIPPGCKQKLAQTIIEISKMSKEELMNMGANGLVYLQNYNWEIESEKLINIYSKLRLNFD